MHFAGPAPHRDPTSAPWCSPYAVSAVAAAPRTYERWTLGSAGVGLLIDADRHTAAHDSPLVLRLTRTACGPVLALAGLPETLPVIMDDNSPLGVT
jgi:hypothetical protein